ncbi:cytochrome P450 [Wolfiporia cocos MD-104 SS10]|uniref:Cytochrome P450 n=1 Tax=Wolfiporia cocos (strain MD-104) TaxID=742152 RepID=A0A2H3ISW2_WOLCO|nr:cytochrome P450 [Wolfiporia cocos MD-104 SS10]
MLRFAKDLRQGYILQAMGEVLDEHGCDTLNTRILWKDNIITRDDLHMRSVHMTSFESFERGPEAAEKMGAFLGNGVFVTDGNRWKRERALIRPFLNKERVSDFEIFTKYAEKALAILNDAAEAGATLDLQDLFSRFTLDSASEFLLGHAPDALSASRPVPFHSRIGSKGAATDDPFGSFLYSFEEVQVTISLRWRLNTFFPLYEMLGDKTKPHADVINKWMKPTVMKALQDKARDREHGVKLNSEERTLLDSLVESTDDEETVRYGILNVLMAGRDTTAGLLTFTVYLLTMYPDVLKRLKEEVLSVLGSSGNPTQEAIRNMPYMNAVLSETLRLYPGAPMGIRNSITEVLLPTADGSPPLYFPPRARVTWLTLLMHRRADLWGADCEEFDPARWLDPARMAAYNARPSIYVPFLSGPRMCPGQMFALSEASFMISRLMQKFSGFELVPEAIPEGAAPPPAWKNGKGRQRIEKVWPSTAFTAFIKGGLWVRPVH